MGVQSAGWMVISFEVGAIANSLGGSALVLCSLDSDKPGYGHRKDRQVQKSAKSPSHLHAILCPVPAKLTARFDRRRRRGLDRNTSLLILLPCLAGPPSWLTPRSTSTSPRKSRPMWSLDEIAIEKSRAASTAQILCLSVPQALPGLLIPALCELRVTWCHVLPPHRCRDRSPRAGHLVERIDSLSRR